MKLLFEINFKDYNPIIIERDTKVLEMELEYIKNNYNKSDY